MQQSMTQGSITKGILLFALPLILGNLLQQPKKKGGAPFGAPPFAFYSVSFSRHRSDPAPG